MTGGNLLKDNISIFITYSWSKNPKDNETVYSFVDFLRQKGYDAQCDKNKTSVETSSNFPKIMNDGLRSDKVIVVLSSSYKEKAENGSGGVGVEYKNISNDIPKVNNKYIFVSFVGTSDEMLSRIVPKLYEGYYVVDLREDARNNFDELFCKINDIPTDIFSEVSKSRYIPKSKKPSEFALKPAITKICSGYSKNTHCKNEVTNATRDLCHECSTIEFRDHIMSLYASQGMTVIVSPKDSSIFYSILKYGFVETVCMVKTFDQYTGKISSDEIIDLKDLIAEENCNIDKKFNQINLVCREAISQIAQEIANKYGYIIRTEEELISNILDLTNYFKEFTESYENSEMFTHFIELNNDEELPLKEVVADFLEDETSQALLLLGEYGCGKTSFCRFLTYTLIKEYQLNNNNYLPIFIPLRDYSKTPSIDDMLTSLFINKYHINNGSILVFRQLIKYGRVVLIFDGFDEIAKRVNYDIKFEAYKEICKYAVGNTRIIMTCRPNFFQDQKEYKKIFEKSYLHYEPGDINDAQFEREYIAGFTEEQILDFIYSYEMDINASGIEIEKFCEIIQATHDLSDLAKRPFLLNIIVKTLPKILAGKGKLGNRIINTANLYKDYTDTWLDREEIKGKTLIKSSDKRAFCEQLAFELFINNCSLIHFSDLQKSIRHYFKNLTNIEEIDYFSHDIQNCSFLNSDGNGNYGFAHKSFMEYFVAKSILEHLNNISRIKDLGKKTKEIKQLLSRDNLTTEISLFINDFLKEDTEVEARICNVIMELVQHLDEEPLYNSISILAKTQTNIASSISQLKNKDLSGFDLSYAHIENCTLDDFDFSGASFYRVAMSNMKFNRCNFTGASFEKAEIEKCKFSKLDLSNSEWRNAIITNCNFSFASLFECSFDEAAFISCNFDSADLSGTQITEGTEFTDSVNLQTALGCPYIME